jgi:krueppel-like factor 5
MPPTMHLNGRVSVSHHQQQVSQQSGVSTPSLPQQRYNRRNNPELEKRRIHRCDYPGLQIGLICVCFMFASH